MSNTNWYHRKLLYRRATDSCFDSMGKLSLGYRQSWISMWTQLPSDISVVFLRVLDTSSYSFRRYLYRLSNPLYLLFPRNFLIALKIKLRYERGLRQIESFDVIRVYLFFFIIRVIKKKQGNYDNYNYLSFDQSCDSICHTFRSLFYNCNHIDYLQH